MWAVKASLLRRWPPFTDAVAVHRWGTSSDRPCAVEAEHQHDHSAVPENRFATIHLIRQGDRTWLFNERGELIIARLDPQGFHELSRAKLLDRTLDQLRQRGGVTWSHPAFAYRHVFARNDKELVCVDLSAERDADRELPSDP